MKRKKTFEVEYNYFEPGTLVRPTSPRCPLYTGIYKVTKMYEPIDVTDEAICFVDGHSYGISTVYLEEVE